ncbi:hypothetical protein ACWEQ3_51470 [Streptomyces mirabilis]
MTTMTTNRIDSLLRDPQGMFRNRWETGTSQAAGTLDDRTAAEEAMGYAAILGRTRGQGGPTPIDASDLPKYAALVSRFQPHGTPVFGNVVFQWKEIVRARTTFTPNDSLARYAQGAHGITGPDHLYPLLAYGGDDTVRLAFAEATDFAYDPEMYALLSHGVYKPSTYFEAQIHGDLSWSDLEQIILPFWHESRAQAETDAARLLAFGQRFNPQLRVVLSQINEAL